MQELTDYMKTYFHLTDESLEMFDKALEKEKEQIMMAYNDGYVNKAFDKQRNPLEYYNQTYNQDRITISETKRSIEGIGLNNQNK